MMFGSFIPFTKRCYGPIIALCRHIVSEMGGVCSIYGGKKGACRLLVRSLRERDHLKNIGVDGMIMFQWFFKWDACIDCIHVPHDRDKWRNAVNAVMNFRVPSNAEIFFVYLRAR